MANHPKGQPQSKWQDFSLDQSAGMGQGQQAISDLGGGLGLALPALKKKFGSTPTEDIPGGY